LIDQIELLGAPVKAFVRDCCVVELGRSATVDALFAEYKIWCADEERRDPGTKAWFCRNLNSAEPGLTTTRPRAKDDSQPGAEENRLTLYNGIGLRKLDAVKKAKESEKTKVDEATPM
jgi:hypothetical protein